MSVDSQTEGGFSGTKRQGMIHYRLFTLLSGYDGHYKRRNGYVENNTGDSLVFSWLMDVKGWENVDVWIFISLARALPDADFKYYTYMMIESGSPDKNINDILYTNGSLYFSSDIIFWDDCVSYSFVCPHCGSEQTTDEDIWDLVEPFECTECGEPIDFDDVDVEEIPIDDEEEDEGIPLICKVNRDGCTDDDALTQRCLEIEKVKLSSLLALLETGTEDPAQLMDIGMIYETGLAGVGKNLTLAWDCYLKAVGTGDPQAAEFVREIFSEENRDEFHDLLKKKQISKDAYPVFFDLAQKEGSAELTAELLEYKNVLGE